MPQKLDGPGTAGWLSISFVPLAITVACAIPGCSGAAGQSALIAAYRTAECIPIAKSDDLPRSGKVWDHTLTVDDRTKVLVYASQSPGGLVTLRRPQDAQPIIAVRPGDYIYPADLRYDQEHQMLYVKADGLAGGIWRETWLFEYDMKRLAIIHKEQVESSALPEECR